MKRKSLLPLVLLVLSMGFASNLQAQKKCKYKERKINPVTGEVIKMSEIKLISINNPPPKVLSDNLPFTLGILKFHNIGGVLQIELYIYFHGILHEYVIPAGTELGMRLNSGEMLKLYSTRDEVKKVRAQSTDVSSVYSIFFDCSREQMQQISSIGGITALAIEFEGKNEAFSVKRRNVIKTAEMARCIMED
ncbi:MULTISPECIES: hypothetical protein [unclassified Carboxylicivirga]|uniref:hypothetical protein n=1 Tax=Carboxylicivirga TaxID=1628153 RepID=UPI003D342035